MYKLIYISVGLLLISCAVNIAEQSLSKLGGTICSFPLIESYCPAKNKQVIGSISFWTAAFCEAFPKTTRCLSNEARSSSGEVRQLAGSTPIIDLGGSVQQKFLETQAIIQTSYLFNDALTHDIYQIRLGVNKANALIRKTDLPPAVKDTAFQLLLDVRIAARDANGCVQAYLNGMQNGINFITASVEHTTRALKDPAPNFRPSRGSLAITGPEQTPFSNTMNAFQHFAQQMMERNGLCHESVLRLESKLDVMVNTFLDAAFASAKQELDATRATFWSLVGRGKAAAERAQDNLNHLDIVGLGIERLSSSTVLLDLHFQQLQAGAMELAAHSKHLSVAQLPAEDVIALLRDGCLSLSRAVASRREGNVEKEAELPVVD